MDDLDKWKSERIKVIDYSTFLAMGRDSENVKELAVRYENTKPGHCAILVYTSGTTGLPKAVMISHDNIVYESLMVQELIPWLGEKEEHLVSYLPLSHIAGQMLDIVTPIVMTASKKGSTAIHFARPDALKGSLGDTLREKRPTFFLGVPRVWEKIAAKMKAKGKQNNILMRFIGNWAKGKGLELTYNRMLGGSGKVPLTYDLAERVVFNKVRAALGLDRCKFAMSGAAPMPVEVARYFGSLGIQINEVYGMSETTGAVTWSTDESYKWGSVGFAMPGIEIKVDHNSERGDGEGEGELCFRGRYIMMGYLYNEKKTREAIDNKGWLHSGDIGRVDKDGMYYITGRLKELIITAGGENIAPVPIEDAIKRYCPALSNVMIIGDKRKYNVCLVSIRATVDSVSGEPLNILEGEAREVDSKCNTIEDVKKSKKWESYIQNGLDQYNKNDSISRAQKIQKFHILDRDFSVNGGELTATLKLKRSIVAKKFTDKIETMY